MMTHYSEFKWKKFRLSDFTEIITDKTDEEVIGKNHWPRKCFQNISWVWLFWKIFPGLSVQSGSPGPGPSSVMDPYQSGPFLGILIICGLRNFFMQLFFVKSLKSDNHIWPQLLLFCLNQTQRERKWTGLKVWNHNFRGRPSTVQWSGRLVT